MSTLYLHIGGPKTGSTYLQSICRTNKPTLLANGIHYPQGNVFQEGGPNSWTSGNGSGILDSPEAFSNALGEIDKYPGSSLLYSHEGLRNDVCLEEKVSFMPEIAKAHGFNRIKVLFFVRNPVAYAVSVWQQFVKNNGMVESLDAKIADPNFMIYSYRNTERILENLSKDDYFDITALNYSKCSDRLFEIFNDWIDIPAHIMSLPEATRINRALTRSELTLQQAMNQILGGDAKILAKALTENLTDIKPEKIIPAVESQQMLWDRIAHMAIRANQLLPEGHEIIFDLQEPESEASDSYIFSAAQLEIIGKTVAEEIRNLRYPYIPPSEPTPEPATSILKIVWNRLKKPKNKYLSSIIMNEQVPL
jgi:hypothetical protein